MTIKPNYLVLPPTDAPPLSQVPQKRTPLLEVKETMTAVFNTINFEKLKAKLVFFDLNLKIMVYFSVNVLLKINDNVSPAGGNVICVRAKTANARQHKHLNLF